MDDSVWQVWAEVDVAGIALFISSDAPLAAERFFREMDAAAEFVRQNPGLGHRHRDLPPEWRVYQVRRWLLIYDPRAKPVVIARVVHGSTDLTKLRLV